MGTHDCNSSKAQLDGLDKLSDSLSSENRYDEKSRASTTLQHRRMGEQCGGVAVRVKAKGIVCKWRRGILGQHRRDQTKNKELITQEIPAGSRSLSSLFPSPFFLSFHRVSLRMTTQEQGEDGAVMQFVSNRAVPCLKLFFIFLLFELCRLLTVL